MNQALQDLLTGIVVVCAAIYILKAFFAKDPPVPQVRVKDMLKKRR